MPDKTLQFKDATVQIHAGLFGGGVSVKITCRDYAVTLDPEEFLALIYPAIDAAANQKAALAGEAPADPAVASAADAAIEQTAEAKAEAAAAPSAADLDAAAGEEKTAEQTGTVAPGQADTPPLGTAPAPQAPAPQQPGTSSGEAPPPITGGHASVGESATPINAPDLAGKSPAGE